jgi:hypothetical protein
MRACMHVRVPGVLDVWQSVPEHCAVPCRVLIAACCPAAARCLSCRPCSSLAYLWAPPVSHWMGWSVWACPSNTTACASPGRYVSTRVFVLHVSDCTHSLHWGLPHCLSTFSGSQSRRILCHQLLQEALCCVLARCQSHT